MKKEILLLFKTHLDIGFTDFSANIVKKYIDEYIPRAVALGHELKDTDTPFIWTVGSWILWEALKYDDGKLDKAIKDGIIVWHSLPFTTHTELMNKELFEYGMSISARLDKRYGRKTIAAKMTDVPGHTMGMIPIMNKFGTEFLHIGVNPATPLPPVPPIFRWKNGENEITVIYQGYYGETEDYGDFALAFAHTNDNLGPQSAEEVIKIYNELREKYPDCNVHAATLDDVAVRLRGMELPVIEKEIGDTWIHGAGTDPMKVAKYRELLRYIEKNGTDGVDLDDNLLLVPEHTWGLNVQTNFDNRDDWTPQELAKEENRQMRERMEKSWQEQREYVAKAEKALGVSVDYNTDKPDFGEFKEIDPSSLDFEISWQLFDNSDYERYKKVYMRLTEENKDWALSDFTKLGLHDYKGGIYTPVSAKLCEKDGRRIIRLDFDGELVKKYGIPYFTAEEYDNKLEIKWFDRTALRMPNAFWIKLKGYDEKWEINKLGQWISPSDIIGSPLITAFYEGVRNKDVEIKSPDAALAAPFGRRLLDYDLNPAEQDLYFNLYNNIWNTNFPMWYSDDARFRFEMEKR